MQRFCTHDGPGIRTTVFFKGCPLSCLWCHNPESQLPGAELMYDEEKCVGCLRCTAVCPRGCHREEDGKHVFSRTACIACGRCVSPLCTALELAGRITDTAGILSEVMRDKEYYDRSGGGITLSGGEPFFQPQFAIDLLKEAKKAGLHTCVETCGQTSENVILESAEHTDLYLFDCKETDQEKHRMFTGTDGSAIMRNLAKLNSLGKDIVLRCPIIPGYNDRPDHFASVAALTRKYTHILRVEVEPYHTLGVNKYRRLGRDYIPENTAQPERDASDGYVAAIADGARVPVTKAL